MSYRKQNYTWSKDNNYLETEYFVNTLEKLKTYSKCINASGYSVTNTLDDIYGILKYQHAFWITLSKIAPDTLELEGLTLEKNFYYNLTKSLTEQQILNSESLKNYISQGYIKAANSLLFEQDGAEDWFTYYEPQIIENLVIDGTNATSGFVYTSTLTTVDLSGTNGTAFSHILIDSNYDVDSFKSTFQKSESEYGYTIRNLFTSDKITSKFLKNFHLVDLATDENFDILKPYPNLTIDGINAISGHRILLKGQLNPVENGIYVYQNSNFILDSAFKTVDDYFLFSVYVKEGESNKEKSFFLDREDGGRFPLVDEDKKFIEADNFIVRNRISYRLLQDHSFTDAIYFTQNEPIININFTENIYSGTNGDFYKVSDNNLSLTFTEGTNFYEYKHLVENTKLLNHIEQIGSEIYLVSYKGNESNLVKFLDGTNSTVYGTDGTGGTIITGTNFFADILNIGAPTFDFNLISPVKGYFLTEGKIKGFNNGVNFLNLDVPTSTSDIQYMNINLKDFYFYLTSQYVAFNYNNKEYIIEKVTNSSKLRVEFVVATDTVNVNFLVDNKPKTLSIEYSQLMNMIDWTKSNEYELNFFSKEKIDQWEVKNNDLYLKDIQITNLGAGTNFNLNVPKVSTGNFRNYDGINDYSLLSTDPINNIKSITTGRTAGSFSIEFKVKPSGIRNNMPVFYLGEKSKIVKNKKLPVFGYISFVLRGDDGFPYFILSTSSSKSLKIKGNKIIKNDEEINVSFTYQYNANKSSGRLYFNGQLVGSIIDQRNNTTKNVPLDIRNINFEQFLLGKTEFNYPNYKGSVSELKLWSRDLNVAQILTRLNFPILPTDILYSDLKGYWKLADIKAFHKEEILGNTSTTSNIFIGGLNMDATLQTIRKVDQIQLSTDNLFVMENGTSGTSGIFRIDLRDEKSYKFFETTNEIYSIHFESTTKKLYHLENNNVYKWSTFTSPSLAYAGSNGFVLDFTVVGQDIFLFKADNKIYDSQDRLIFGDGFSSFKTFYGAKQTDLNLLNLYWKESNDKINLLSDSYSNSSSGLNMNYIASYPFTSNMNLVNNGTYSVINNILHKDGVAIDNNNMCWELNLNKINGIYNRGEEVLILVTTIDNEVQLWSYKQNGSCVRFADKKGNPTLLSSAGLIDLTYIVANNDEYITILNSDEKTITWFKLEKGNKFNWSFMEWSSKWTSDKTAIEIENFSNTNLTLLSEKNSQKYLSTISTPNINYNLWKNSLEYNQKTDGWIIGSSGLLFTDTFTSGTDWSIDIKNLLYKNDFSDLEIYIEEQKRANGYVVPTWSGLAWMIGENGTIIRTKDNGNSWDVLDSTVNHNLTSMSFIDDRNGLIVGDSDTILSTFTSGDNFSLLQLPFDVSNRDWTKVIYYHSNKAILMGNGGTMVHISKINSNWKVDRILNNLNLTKLDKAILDSDLDNSIKLLINKNGEEDQFNQVLYCGKYLGVNKDGNDTFLIVGERDLIAHMELKITPNYIVPVLNFLNTNSEFDWKQVVVYNDLESNLNNALLVNNTNIYQIEWNRWTNKEDSNVHDVELLTFRSDEFENINRIAFWNENHIISVGDRVTANKHTLFDVENGTAGVGDLSYFITSNELVEQDLKTTFTPKLLFLDYYLGRKINLHLEEGGFEVPKAEISKSLLSCFKFKDGESIEFTDYGTVNNQNNFLAFQDYYFLNRRTLDGGNTFGKMEPWNKFNKKLIANSNYLDVAVWEGTNGLFTVSNEAVTNPATYTTGLFETSKTTKFKLDSSSFISTKNDVLKVNLVKTNKNIAINENDTIHFYINTPEVKFNIDITAIVTDGRIITSYLNLPVVDNGSFITVANLETLVSSVVLSALNSYLLENSKPLVSSGDITVNVALSILSDYALVREYDTVTNTISIWDLYNEDIIGDVAYGAKLYLKNLNYFNGNLIHLEEVFNQHLISQSYKLTINKKDTIYVEGVVNDNTKYYNLESYVLLSTFDSGTSGSMTVNTFPVKYSEDVIYGPQYNLESMLNNINPVFADDYEFDFADETFTYNNLIRTSTAEFKEFTITNNKIYVGEELASILNFKAGTFCDITRGTKAVTRAYLSKIEVSNYENYPTKKRYILHFDFELENNLQDSSLVVRIRTRNKLSELSQDLEFTDNLMFPLPNGGTNGVSQFNKSYFNQTKTSSAYAKLLLNDDNIRRYVSAVVFLDDENDWNINIINWQTDPNLYYRPVDLHEFGIDKIFKKAISIEPKNLKIDSNKFILNNIDLEKFNFRLVDGLSLKELERKYYWLLNADVKNAIIGEDVNGLVWYQGDWLGGIWEEGTWYSGRIFDIEWIKGNFYSYKINNNFNLVEVVADSNSSNSIWYKGFWGSGNWFNGTWKNGEWNKGNRYNGLWYNGTWKNGTWYSGNFQGGTWLNGTWLSGNFSEISLPSTWHNGTWLGGDFENGVWKNGTWDQTVRVASRFGTKASLLHPAIWEYGFWKNGEFHSGLTLNTKGEPVASENIKNSVWYNGVWDKGNFYGGVWKFGRWNNGVWVNGLLESDLSIDTLNFKMGVGFEVKFNKAHYFKEITGVENYFMIMGKPEYEMGEININTQNLGHNTNPVKHTISQIVDEKTVIFNVDLIYTPTASTSGTSGTSSTSGCVDYTLESVEEFITDELALVELGYKDKPMVATHWSNGTWLGGMWIYGYFGNGFWKGGIWVDGVYENGTFGE